MLKVLQIIGDPTGGIRKHVHEIIKSCYEGEIQVHYAHGEIFDVAGKMDLKEFDSNRLRRITLSIPKRPHVLDLKNVYLLIRYCRYHRIDIVHGHGAKGGLYSRLVGLLAGIPSVYTPHGGSVHSCYGLFYGILYRSTERVLKPITRLYLFESSYTYNSFIAASGRLKTGRYMINHNGVDGKAFSPVRHWSEGLGTVVNILVAGALRDIKGQEVAIRALAILIHMNGRDFRLHLCGDGPNREKLELLVKEYQLDNHVFFHGEVPNVLPWYEMCSVVVIPSLFESFGYVAVEAALMRRPVIASDVGGLPEVVLDNETGTLFPGGDHVALAAKIINVIQDVNKSEEMVVSAENRARENFSLDSMIQNIKSAYHRVLAT